MNSTESSTPPSQEEALAQEEQLERATLRQLLERSAGVTLLGRMSAVENIAKTLDFEADFIKADIEKMQERLWSEDGGSGGGGSQADPLGTKISSTPEDPMRLMVAGNLNLTHPTPAAQPAAVATTPPPVVPSAGTPVVAQSGTATTPASGPAAQAVVLDAVAIKAAVQEALRAERASPVGPASQATPIAPVRSGSSNLVKAGLLATGMALGVPVGYIAKGEKPATVVESPTTETPQPRSDRDTTLMIEGR